MTAGRRILLGVTIDDSLQFLKGYPQYLVARGWEVHVAATPGPRLELLRQEPGVHVHPLNMARTPNPLQDVAALIAWLGLVRSVRPDVVSVGTPKAGLLGTVSAWVHRVPVRVYTLRGLRLQTISGVRRAVLTAVERLVMRCATDVISVSHSLRRAALELRLTSADHIRVIGEGSSNGTNAEEFDSSLVSQEERARLRESLALEPGVPVLGYVGRLTRDKGPFVLADALEELRARGIRVQLLVLGEVDDATGEEAVARLRSTGQPIVLAGHVFHPESHYSIMDMLCLPSFREGFVNVALEASSSSIPIVASDATGVVDTVVDCETGLVSPVRDAKALADNIERLVRDPELRARLGKAGRERVLAHYRRPDVQARYTADLEAALARASGARR